MVRWNHCEGWLAKILCLCTQSVAESDSIFAGNASCVRQTENPERRPDHSGTRGILRAGDSSGHMEADACPLTSFS